MKPRITLPAEWAPQTAVQLTWPHRDTDWAYMLDDINSTYVEMASAIASRELLVVVTPCEEEVRTLMAGKVNMENVVFHTCQTNDTWARDHGLLTLSDGTALDFCFNGWGEKFVADKDNAINASLYASETLRKRLGIDRREDHNDFVLEGGSIESDGRGTIFTTTGCLMAPHRNQPLTQQDIDRELRRRLHAERIVWIDYGHLEGDDTDGHIDTLVRIAPDNTLLYIDTDDTNDAHYADLKAMEAQLRSLQTVEGAPYRLLRLPLPHPIFDEDGLRLPATHANFLVMNGAVLVPTYAQPDVDDEAISTIQKAFPNHEMVPIDSRAIIRQHGSIHCCTMQFPVIKPE
ncbi:MAG: agmatine deiminase family protein [Prevotella sp.]|nr:agmatine deiminase family protein [Prevotella sp.]